MSRAHLQPEQRFKRVNFTLDRETLDRLDALVPARGRTRSEVIRNVIEAAMAKLTRAKRGKP